MAFNTFPCNPYPISTEELNKGNNDDLQKQIDAIKDGTTIDSFGDVETALSGIDNTLGTKANQITIAPFFNAETVYTAGDLVYYNGLTYRCTNDHEGAWDADDFAATTIANELDTLKSGLTNATTINNQIIGNFLLSKVGHVVMVSLSNGVISTDSEGYVLFEGERFVIPSGYRPINTTNIMESYAGKRVSINIPGYILMPNDLSATDLVIRFEAVYLAN